MKKNLLSLFVLVLLFLGISLEASAQEKAYVGYCNGSIATSATGNITGITGTNATINLAILLTKVQLEAYQGCQISAVNWGAPDASQLPESATGWVRHQQTGDNLSAGTLTSLKKGWNEIALAEPITITEDMDSLWIGVEYPQASKLTTISFAGETSLNGCYAGKGGKFTDYSGKGWGSLSVEAIITGTVPTHNISFITTKCNQSVVQIGKPITISGTIKNNASETAKKPVINYVLNGDVKGAYTVPKDITYRNSTNFSFEIPTTSITEESTANIDLELVWADGSVDEAPGDNVATLSCEMVNQVCVRAMVVEEGTGAWCGWCVRGIVGLKEMREKYPDRFIGIGVHNGDDYVVSSYDSFLGNYISGFPSCLINRDGKTYNPSFNDLENYYNTMDEVSEATIDVEANYDAESGKVQFNAEAMFIAGHTDAQYRIAFIVVEDQLPIVQSNYYSGGGAGTMGGFEEMGSKVKINIDDVARGIYPSPYGASSSLPSTIEKGVHYTYTYTTNMPKIANIENVAVVAVIVDNKTGEIIQGIKTEKIGALNGIHTVISPEARDHAVYNLSGHRVSADTKGIVIENGKKVIK